MGLPAKLKNFILFDSGYSHQGEVAEVTLPKLSLKTDDWRGGGMLGEVKIDMGLDPQPLEWKAGGILRNVLREFGVTRYDGLMLRFVGAYQADDTGQVLSAELVIRGRHTEVDPGTAKPGDANEFSVTTAWTYLKWTVANEVLVEIDLINMIFITGGVDRQAELRLALGL